MMFPKPIPLALERARKRRFIAALDRAGTRATTDRSMGRCEVTVGGWRCRLRATETHHHLGGWRLRGRGASALAEHKTHACQHHHHLITRNRLRHVGGNDYVLAPQDRQTRDTYARKELR